MTIVMWAILGIFGAVITLLTHEGAHYVVNRAVGRTITEVKLWPHYHNNKLYFARVSSTGSGEDLDIVHLAPVVKAFLLMLIWIIGGLYFYSPIFVLAIIELVDMLWWLKGYFFGPDHTDGAKFRKML